MLIKTYIAYTEHFKITSEETLSSLTTEDIRNAVICGPRIRGNILIETQDPDEVRAVYEKHKPDCKTYLQDGLSGTMAYGLCCYIEKRITDTFRKESRSAGIVAFYAEPVT